MLLFSFNYYRFPISLTLCIHFQRSANSSSNKSINFNSNTSTVRVNCSAAHRRPPIMEPNRLCQDCVNLPDALASASIVTRNEAMPPPIRIHREIIIPMNRLQSQRAVFVARIKCQHRRSTIRRVNSSMAWHHPHYNRIYWVQPLWPHPHNRRPHEIERTVWMCRYVRDTVAVPVAVAIVANRHATMITITWPGPTTIIVITQLSGIIKVSPTATKVRSPAIVFDIKV